MDLVATKFTKQLATLSVAIFSCIYIYKLILKCLQFALPQDIQIYLSLEIN